MQIQKYYRVPDESFEIFDILPTGPAWNYLRAVLKPESPSSEDLGAVVKITKGVAYPHPTTREHLYQYPTSGKNFLIGTKGRRTKWEKIEIVENEPFWVNQARTLLLNNDPHSEMAEIYILDWLELLRNAYQFEDNKDIRSDLRIWVYPHKTAGHEEKMMLDMLGDKEDQEMATLKQTFDRALDPVPGEYERGEQTLNPKSASLLRR